MLYFCNLAGSIACSKVGAISVTLSEIENHPSIKEKFGPDKKFILY
jgi:bifunctional ADP-heptose synthase (sugar kinase/adenylyltransferase)